MKRPKLRDYEYRIGYLNSDMFYNVSQLCKIALIELNY